MSLFRVSGKFADNYTFSVNPVDGTDARDALSNVLGSPEIREYGETVVMVTVKSLTGAKKRIRISDKPAAERKGGGRKKGSTNNTPAATAVTPPANAAPTKRR
jgi:hypothetical protein